MGFLKNLVKGELFSGKSIVKGIADKPTRLITGIDPLQTKAWNSITGSNNKPLVNMWGSPDEHIIRQAEESGIDMGPSRAGYGVAEAIAAMYAANGLANGGLTGGSGAAGAGGAGAAGAGGAGGAGGAAAAGGGGFLSAIGGPSGALKLATTVGGALAANSGGSKSSDTTVTTKQELDPRAQAIIYGDGTEANGGLLSKYMGLGAQPQSPGLLAYGQANDAYLGANGMQDLQGMRTAAGGLLSSGIAAPQAQAVGFGAPAWKTGSMVDAPSQNSLDLKPAYDRFINGNPAENPYLKQAIQGGIGQSQQAFDRMQGDSTRNLMENVLPGIRSNAVLAGQVGGSRQGITEGRAIGDMQREQQRVIQNFGDNNTTAAVGAQAGAFDRGQDRSLSAMQGLGAQQYGVASQNAATRNMAEFGNVDQVHDVRKTMAGLEQQTNLANMGSQQQTNALNSANRIAGIGATGGLLSSTLGAAQNQDTYGLNRASQVNGLLAPYLSMGGSQTQTQPMYSNKAGNYLGGAMAGLGLYNQFFGNSGGSSQAPAWNDITTGWQNGTGY